jgi:ribosomal protein S18 acetylase RimI-like enzyme
MHFNIIKTVNRDSAFYQLMGKFLGNRKIIKILGEPLFDDDNKEWFLALSEQKEVIGFASVTIKNDKVYFADSWTVEEYRKQGIFNALLVARIKSYPGKRLQTICNNNSFKYFQLNGFQLQKQTKNYYFMYLEN